MQLGTPRVGPRPLRSQPRPQLLERAASKVARFTASDLASPGSTHGQLRHGRCAARAAARDEHRAGGIAPRASEARRWGRLLTVLTVHATETAPSSRLALSQARGLTLGTGIGSLRRRGEARGKRLSSVRFRLLYTLPPFGHTAQRSPRIYGQVITTLGANPVRENIWSRSGVGSPNRP